MKIIRGDLYNATSTLIEELLKTQPINGVREITNCCLVIKNPSLKDMCFGYRNISKDYSEKELQWYWSGDNSCKTIGQHAKLWLNISDDGETSNSAYGYIIHSKYGFDQLQQIIQLLKDDPNTRRAVLNISDPTIDRIHTKDMQCTIAIQFLIRHNRLEETVYMRSNDVYFGFPYDYIYFVSIGQYVAKKLGLKLKLYTHHATSMHMYERDVQKFKIHDNVVTINAEQIIKENYDEE